MKTFTVKNWRGQRSIKADQLFTPTHHREGGIAENAEAQAASNAAAIGNLIAILEEKGLITLKEALTIVSYPNEVLGEEK